MKCRFSIGMPITSRCSTATDYIKSAQRFPDVPRLTTMQIEALDLFDALANDPSNCLDIEFKPGDIQLIHNHVILHDRTDYEDWPDGTQATSASPVALSAERTPIAADLRRPIRRHEDRQPRRHSFARRRNDDAAGSILEHFPVRTKHILRGRDSWRIRLGVKASRTSADASQSASLVRSAALRSSVLSLAKAISMGLRSGE